MHGCTDNTYFHINNENESLSFTSDSLPPHVLWNSLGQNTGVGGLSLLQGIFPPQGSNPGLPQWRWFFTNWAIRKAILMIVTEKSKNKGDFFRVCNPEVILPLYLNGTSSLKNIKVWCLHRQGKQEKNRWDYVKLKYLHSEEDYQQREKAAYWMEMVLTNNTYHKKLISKIHKEPIRLNIRKKKKTQIKKWPEDLNRKFSKVNIKMANRHMKRCEISLILRQVQIKTTIR